jgi:CheY-like chemotaxis protein
MKYQHILLIDDDEEDQEIFMTAVKDISNNVTCTTFFDGTQALKKLEEKQTVPDVIFLDLNMPVMNGQQFIAEVKKNVELKNIPVIIFSTSSHSPTIHRTKDLGATDFITLHAKYNEPVKILTPQLC